MKKPLIFLLLTISLNLSAQAKISEVQKYKQIGLVWGLLKYHHPEISKGKYNWDAEFIKLVDKSNTIETQEDLNVMLIDFIATFNKNSKLKKREVKIDSEHLFTKNVDYSWIDSEVFGVQLTQTIVELKDNGNVDDYYVNVSKLAKMLTFENEKGFKDFDYSIKSNRLLVLYSFWNAVEYWNVNKYLTDEKWLDILDTMTNDFINAKTEKDYELAKLKLITKLDDTHSYYTSDIIINAMIKKKSYLSYKVVNDTIAILGLYKSLAKKDGIEVEDRIVKIENQSISTYLNNKLSNLIPVSNPTVLKRYGYWLFFNEEKDSINVDVISKNGIQSNKYIHLYDANAFDAKDYEYKSYPKKREQVTLIQPDIAYINLEKINAKELKVAFKEIANTKGLIIDLRNYPKNISDRDLAKHLYPERKEFVKVLFPVSKNPSLGEYDADNTLDVVVDAFKAGSHNPDYYKGKVILLVNAFTQSKAEYFGMVIQQSPNCTTIGEQTAGAVMNVVPYTLPDKTKVNFTSLGAFYPNGEGVQRKGLHIDYTIKESAKNYDTDLYVKEAVKLIEK